MLSADIFQLDYPLDGKIRDEMGWYVRLMRLDLLFVTRLFAVYISPWVSIYIWMVRGTCVQHGVQAVYAWGPPQPSWPVEPERGNQLGDVRCF